LPVAFHQLGLLVLGEHALELDHQLVLGSVAARAPYELHPGARTGELQAGRVWTNCYHAYPAHAAFGGYKGSGIGRETHKMMLEHYQQTKNLLVPYAPQKLGLF